MNLEGLEGTHKLSDHSKGGGREGEKECGKEEGNEGKEEGRVGEGKEEKKVVT